jgi:broad specificity phosphatase PhoE
MTRNANRDHLGIKIVFVTHSTSTDNEAGIASGNRDVGLSELGRRQAAELGERSRGRYDVVYCSDLRRAVETAEIAFGSSFRTDARLREQDYGSRSGAPADEIAVERPRTIETPFPDGESLRDSVERMRSFLGDLGDPGRVLIIGHRATKIALDHLLGATTLEEAASAEHVWEPSWTYALGARATPS